MRQRVERASAWYPVRFGPVEYRLPIPCWTTTLSTARVAVLVALASTDPDAPVDDCPRAQLPQTVGPWIASTPDPFTVARDLATSARVPWAEWGLWRCRGWVY
jgi:hypothetical protein